VNTFFNMKFH